MTNALKIDRKQKKTTISYYDDESVKKDLIIISNYLGCNLNKLLKHIVADFISHGSIQVRDGQISPVKEM